MREIPIRHELPQDIVLFSLEQRQALEKSGYETYQLTGRTIQAIHDGDYPLLNPLPNPWEKIKEFLSMRSEVAVQPQLFLPQSAYKTFDEQMRMVNALGEEISARIPGVGAMIGTLADYVELASLDSKKRGGASADLDNLCAPSESIRTQTAVASTRRNPHGVLRLNVGAGRDGKFWAHGLFIDAGFPDYERDLHMWVIPLIVPTSSLGVVHR